MFLQLQSFSVNIYLNIISDYFFFDPISHPEIEHEILLLAHKKAYGLHSCSIPLLKFAKNLKSFAQTCPLSVEVVSIKFFKLTRKKKSSSVFFLDLCLSNSCEACWLKNVSSLVIARRPKILLP